MPSPHTCERKVKYDTEKIARQGIYEMKKKKVIFEYLKVYKCKFCKKWHIGNLRRFGKHKPKNWRRGIINV